MKKWQLEKLSKLSLIELSTYIERLEDILFESQIDFNVEKTKYYTDLIEETINYTNSRFPPSENGSIGCTDSLKS